MEDYQIKNMRGIIITVIVVAALYGIYTLFFNKPKDETDNKIDVVLVNDYNRFYTVSSCVTKYLNTLSSNNVENILTILDKNYKEKNNITEDNIYNYINKVDDVYSFSPRKMYYKETNNYITKYYIYGTIEKSTINQSDEAKDYYIIVYLDSQNRLEKVICGYYIDFGLNICHSTYEIFYKYGDDVKMPYNIDEEVK